MQDFLRSLTKNIVLGNIAEALLDLDRVASEIDAGPLDDYDCGHAASTAVALGRSDATAVLRRVAEQPLVVAA